MSFKVSDVEKVAHLARLKIAPEQIEAYASDLDTILHLVAQLTAVETAHIEPMAHPMDQVQRLREDAVSETDQHQKFQKIAPAVEADLYLVPRVVE